MTKHVIVIGAGGHGSVVSEIIKVSGDEFIGFLDDDRNLNNTLGVIDDYKKYPDAEYVIGIGNVKIRERISSLPLKWYTAIHPSAVISESAIIGEGTVVMANTVVNAGALIGRHCILNTASVVEHNNVIEDFVHVSVGVKLGGCVRIRKSTWVGIGTTVSNDVTICSGCMIGAGAVIVNNITSPGTYVGVPVKKEGGK